MADRRKPPPGWERERRSDATFWSDGTTTRHAYWGPAQAWWWRRAGWKRALAKAPVIPAAYGMLFHRAVTERALAVATGAAGGLGLVRFFTWREQWGHDRAVVKPLACRLTALLDQPVRDRRSWLTVPPDYGTDDAAEIVIGVPEDFTAADRDMEDLTRAVTVSTGWMAPKAEPVLRSRHPRLVYTKSLPPPPAVSLEDIRPHIDAARPSEVILGLARKSEPARLDLDSETPMLGFSMSTGEGKSEAAKNVAAQVLYHGGILMILDYKLVSHMWADGLRNVCYARTPAEIQEALMWLAWDDYDDDGNVMRASELTRRKQVVLAARRAGQKPNPGPRLLVLAEERNATARAIRRFHRRMGGKGAPPALESLDETGETGRQVCVNKLDVAQRFSAKASGSDGSADARENIGAIVTKDPKEATWKMLAGGHAQPPRSGHKGRYQLITAPGVTEFQGVLYHKDPVESDRIARELAMAGTIGQVPHDMPFVYRGPLLVPAGMGQDARARQEGSEQGFVLGPEVGVLTAGEGPGRAVTLAEAVAAGVFVSIGAARKAAQRRGWEPAGGTRAGGWEYRVEDLYAYKREQEKR